MGVLVSTPPKKVQDLERPRGVAPFEFVANAYAFATPSGMCAGGGASAAFRLTTEWQVVLDVNGCKMTGLEKNLTGDSLTYMAGPRWTPAASGRLIPYGQVLLGGNKLTQELMFPERKQSLEQLVKDASKEADHGQYTQQFELDGFAISAGAGLNLRLNRALAIRLIRTRIHALLSQRLEWFRHSQRHSGQDGRGVEHGHLVGDSPLLTA